MVGLILNFLFVPRIWDWRALDFCILYKKTIIFADVFSDGLTLMRMFCFNDQESDSDQEDPLSYCVWEMFNEGGNSPTSCSTPGSFLMVPVLW